MTRTTEPSGRLVTLVLAGPLAWFPQPDLQEGALLLERTEWPCALPVFAVPERDSDNPILGLFVHELDPRTVELQLVTEDEDHPIPLIDRLYDLDRWWGLVSFTPSWPFLRLDLERRGWHRVADVETIRLHLDPGGALNSLEFPRTWAGDQGWGILAPRHHARTLSVTAFEQLDGRPVVHVATWNHLFSSEDRNPGLTKELVTDFPVLRGSRADVEALFEASWTDFGLDL